MNGEKNWVFNGSLANSFIVFSITNSSYNEVGEKVTKLSAFIVDADSPGITIQKNDTFGIDVVDVLFKDTPVPVGKFINFII